MAGIDLRPYQLEAVKKLKTGSILCGGVGSGKSRTALAAYYLSNDGEICTDEYSPMGDPPQDLYIITTARKRDLKEWEGEMAPFLMSTNPEVNFYKNKIVVDSWNNIAKYVDAKGAFFIFDEQRVVGKGAWVKSFLKIAKVNDWLLLSATPGDTWSDYIPVFIANGFYKNRSEFYSDHVVWNPHSSFPKIDRYLNTGRLIRLRSRILVDMDFKRETIPHHEDIYAGFDQQMYKDATKNRWDPYKNEPITSAGGLYYVWRKIVNSDISRQQEVISIVKEHPRAIIFYNFDYELDILKGLKYGDEVSVAEWNGHKHQEIPDTEQWVYLVQYTAGCEGWNCVKTDTIIFYSQNYSYKVTTQAAGRIDRLNTAYRDLYYYHLKSHAWIDMAISRDLKNKKDFNESRYYKW